MIIKEEEKFVMSFKKSIWFLSFLLVFSSFPLGFGSATIASASTITNLGELNSVDSSLDEKTVNIADQYISVENDKYIIKDTDKLISIIGQEEFNKVQEQINGTNLTLAQIKVEEAHNMNYSVEEQYLIGLEPEIEATAIKSYVINTKEGKLGVEMHWWGYRVYLNDNATNTVAQTLLAGGGVSAMVAALTPILPGPTAVVKAVATAIAIGLGGSGGMFYKTNKGKGVYLRLTGVIPATVVYTGMFAQ